MATGSKNIGFKFTVVDASQAIIKTIDTFDIDILNETLDVSWQEPEQLKIPTVKKEIVTQQVVNEKQRINEEIDKWKEYLRAAEGMQNALRGKLNDRVVRVPSKKDPSVRDAIRRIFGVDSDTITYDMFRKCLELRSEVAEQQRKSTYGDKSQEDVKK